MKRTGKARAIIAILALGSWIGLSSCSVEPVGAEQPKNEAYVLVDLSETWHNPSHADRNARTLGEIGAGLSIAADSLEPPYLVQYRVIGMASYEREPVCDVEYVPSLVMGGKGDDRRITRSNKLAEYLATDCTRQLLLHQAESQTEISAALRSVADQPRAKGARRRVIIASDFLEESAGGVELGDAAFDGTNVLLLYRPLPQDQVRPSDTIGRIEVWRERLTRSGATVTVMPDTAIRRSQIVTFVTSKK